MQMFLGELCKQLVLPPRRTPSLESAWASEPARDVMVTLDDTGDCHIWCRDMLRPNQLPSVTISYQYQRWIKLDLQGRYGTVRSVKSVRWSRFDHCTCSNSAEELSCWIHDRRLDRLVLDLATCQYDTEILVEVYLPKAVLKRFHAFSYPHRIQHNIHQNSP